MLLYKPYFTTIVELYSVKNTFRPYLIKKKNVFREAMTITIPAARPFLGYIWVVGIPPIF